MISQPAQAGGRDVRCGLCRPFHGLDEFSHALTQGSASLQHPSGAAPLGTPLHPGLYASACSAGSLKAANKVVFTSTIKNLAKRTRGWWLVVQRTCASKTKSPVCKLFFPNS